MKTERESEKTILLIGGIKMKNKKIEIRVTEKQKAEIMDFCDNEGITISEYVLSLIRKDLKENEKLSEK